MKKLLLLLIGCTIASPSAWGVKLGEADIDVDTADFYLLDIYDGSTAAISAIDVYIVNGQTFVALSPLLEGLGLNYQIQENNYSIQFNDKEIDIELVESLALNGSWFYDGFYHFIDFKEFEKLFDTQVTMDIRTLRASLTGHTEPFPHLVIKKNTKQRKERNVTFLQEAREEQATRYAITVPDKYSLINVPNGRYQLAFDQSRASDSYDLELETVGDLAYHSASMLFNTNEDQTNSRLTFTRYPSEPDEKIFGLWDRYSFGDVFTSNFTSTSSSRVNRGLGFSARSNYKGEDSQNMRTSFVIYAKPEWEADVFQNGVFLETRIVPEDGVLEFNDVELNYGNNEFKFLFFGPFGEEEEQIKRIQVDRNPLSKGGFSYRFSLLEQQSSIFDIDVDEFDIDQASISMSYGLADYWTTGLSTTFSRNILDGSIQTRGNINNRFSLPGWLFDNSLSINEDSIRQRSSLATSFFARDSLVIDFRSDITTPDNVSKSHDFSANYNFFTDKLGHSFIFRDEKSGGFKQRDLSYWLRGNIRGFSFFNRLSYRKFTEEERIEGSFDMSARPFGNFRLTASIPYDFKGDEFVEEDAINLGINYNIRTESNQSHRLSFSHRPLSDSSAWNAGYNYAATFPGFRLVSRLGYNSNNNWRVSAGIEGYFGYDYFKNEFVFDNQNITRNSNLNVHAYLDRHLNGVPDILDYSLEGVEIVGGRNRKNYLTNEKGRVRAIGNVSGVTALKTSWKHGAKTINNDYLIYSHPGGNQNINLPFYLSTELELFILLELNGEQRTWQNVPVIAKNLSTNDVYTINSDFDGYVNFIDLLPGTYEVIVDPVYLSEKGYNSDILGFTFDTPARGGFVILPNIVLARELASNKQLGEIQHITLNEDNYIPLFESDDDRLVHLPPKGAFTAPYTKENIQNAEFKRMNKRLNERKRQRLAASVSKLRKEENLAGLGLRTFDQQTNHRNRTLLREFVSRLKQSTALSVPYSASTQTNRQPPAAAAMQVYAANTSNDQPGLQIIPASFQPKEYSIDDTHQKLTPKNGWVIQYMASESYDSALNYGKEIFKDTEYLHMSKKQVNGKDLFCLTSQEFPTKDDAIAFKNTELVNGFVVSANQFTEVLWSRK